VLDDELIVIAKNQTKGRGQMHSNWQSHAGQSLTFSVFKRFKDLSVLDQSQITFATTLGIERALENLQVPSVSIKWPNDIMSYRKKLCGILIENQTLGEKLSSSVIGIGLNVNETKFDNLNQATSMRLASGKPFNLEEVFSVIAEEILQSLQQINHKNLEKLKLAYEACLFRKDQVSVFEDTLGAKFRGIIRGVSNSGKLQVELEDEILREYELKQIKMLF